MSKLFRRCLLLALCLMLAVSPALGEGMRFSLTASVHPEAWSAEVYGLLSGLAQLLEVARVEGEFVHDGGRFTLDTTLHAGSGADACDTTLSIHGIPSHWGVRSSLLGDTPLMVNCASLLPFGQKARNYLGLPLDVAALLVPFTHVDAFSSVMALLAPLFPEEDGKLTFSRAEMDAMVTEFSRLCDEDPALHRYLEVTGLYSTAKYICRGYFALPEFLLPSLTVRRSGASLTWTSGLFTLLSIREKKNTTTFTAAVPTLAEASLTITEADNTLNGDARISLDGLEVNASFALPVRLTDAASAISLTLDATSPILPEGGFHLRVSGETRGNALTLRLLDPDTSAALLTVEGTLVPFAADALPDWQPEDFRGVDVLSVNSDSLRALLAEVKWPLLSGLFDLLVAAPAPAVQTLMDYAEDSGLIDLLTDALSGGSGY